MAKSPVIAINNVAIEQFGRHEPGCLFIEGAPGIEKIELLGGRERTAIRLRPSDFRDFLRNGVLREVEVIEALAKGTKDPGEFAGSHERPSVPGFSWLSPASITKVSTSQGIAAVLGALGPDDEGFLDRMIEAEREGEEERPEIVELLNNAKVAKYGTAEPQRRMSPGAREDKRRAKAAAGA